MGQVSQPSSSDDSSASLAKLLDMKRCPSCSSRLPLHAFYTAGRSKSGQTRLHSHCKRCKLQRETERRAARCSACEQESSPSSSLSSSVPSQLPPSLGHRNRVPEHASGVKLCTSCHRNKPLDRFYTAGRHKTGAVRFHSHCKSCKLENEALQRMQPRKGSQQLDMSEAIAGLPAHLRPEQQPGPPATTLLQQLQASRMPQQPLVGHMPGLLNPQQLQGLLMLRQHPAMFSNPVLQSQLAMLMWSQMQQQQAPMWPLHQPGPMLQPAGGHQPSSAAAQSASTHQPSCPGPVPLVDSSSPLSQECNSSGGSNDSGCMQTVSGSTPKAAQSLSTEPHAHFGKGNQRFADDSDSAVTRADRAGRGTEQTACTQSRSAGHHEASGTQFCLHNSGQLSGRDVTSSHLPEATQWLASGSPAPTAPPPVQLPPHSPYALQRKPSGGVRNSGHHTTADAIQLARAASDAAKQSCAATAAITDTALPHKGSSSLLADLRQAERQWNEAKQASAPAQQPHQQQQQQSIKAPEIKRSSRQAARVADQTQLAAELSEQILPPLHTIQQLEVGPMIHTGLPVLQWGSRKRTDRVRSHRRRGVKPSDQFLGWTVAGGVLKPVAPAVTKQPPAAAMAAPRAVQAHPRAGPEARAFRVEPRAARADSKGVRTEPLLLASAAVKAPEEIAPAYIPRHSRKKGKVQRSAFE